MDERLKKISEDNAKLESIRNHLTRFESIPSFPDLTLSKLKTDETLKHLKKISDLIKENNTIRKNTSISLKRFLLAKQFSSELEKDKDVIEGLKLEKPIKENLTKCQSLNKKIINELESIFVLLEPKPVTKLIFSSDYLILDTNFLKIMTEKVKNEDFIIKTSAKVIIPQRVKQEALRPSSFFKKRLMSSDEFEKLRKIFNAHIETLLTKKDDELETLLGKLDQKKMKNKNFHKTADYNILSFAREHQCTILTEDKDFNVIKENPSKFHHSTVLSFDEIKKY